MKRIITLLPVLVLLLFASLCCSQESQTTDSQSQTTSSAAVAGIVSQTPAAPISEANEDDTRTIPANISCLNMKNLPVFIMLIMFGCFLFIIRTRAKHGKLPELRRLAGINAIEEAIGRATEMGRPVLFIPGINDIDDIQTLAGVNILSHVAFIAAEYDTPIIVATRRSVTLAVCEETVKQASLAAGRPEVYVPNNMRYLSDDQFAFTAGVNGIMIREKPASAIYQGCFYSESLILAETGNMTGTIQVAGTANPTQLPFFVAACDYTLIGEEFFAASAYLSKDLDTLASVTAADWLKAVLLPIIILGTILATISAFMPEAGAETTFSMIAEKTTYLLELLKEIF
ncbi:hypothetical protein GX645_06700 [Candidatus Sumerlaeota bacterium]|nr:hypothetical protein [Candidatus Sumerlaeales bacterium]NLD62127.1 hypothetical protein [Candidatus Sumerlaeota bacterium]